MYIYAKKRSSTCDKNPFWIDLARLHQNFITFSGFLRDFWRSRSFNFRSGTESVNDVVAASTYVFVARFPGPGYFTTATGAGCGGGGGTISTHFERGFKSSSIVSITLGHLKPSLTVTAS
jgi:hypothetical protein